MAWNEDELHRWLARRARPRILRGSVGHDAAVLGASGEREVLCSDQTIEGVHFEAGCAPADVGRKAANRALSDLAATAARARSLLLNVAAPQRVEAAWLKRLIQAVARAAEAAGAELVGGDLSGHSGPLVISVFASGSLAGRRRPPGRDRARPGQRVVLTGPVGGSRAQRHLRFRPRLEEGRALFAAGATALMDVSDGLAWDLFRLARASRVRIDLNHVPIHRDARRAARLSGRSPLDHGLHDGEDHELIACLGRGPLPAGCVEIGRVERGAGLLLDAALIDEERPRPWRPQMGGWKHG